MLGDEYNLSSDNHHGLSSSPLPTRNSRQIFFEDDSPPRRHPGSMSAYDYNPCFSGSASGNVRNSSARSIPNPRSSQQPRSHISISSDDPDTTTTELILLRNQNTKLKLEAQRLRGHLDGMTCVSVNILSTYHSRSCQRRVSPTSQFSWRED